MLMEFLGISNLKIIGYTLIPYGVHGTCQAVYRENSVLAANKPI